MKDPMAPFSTIYKKLDQLLEAQGGLERFLSNEPGHAITLKSGGFMDLHIDLLGRNHMSLAHYYRQNGDSIADPDMEIRIHPDVKCAEALTYQDTYGYREVYPEPGKVAIRAKKELNALLNQWLSNLKAQGFFGKPDERGK